MTAIATQASATHWLVRALDRAGRARPGLAPIAPGAPIAEVWETLMRETGLTASELAGVAAAFTRRDEADLSEAEPTASRLLPEAIARRYTVYPLRHTDHDVVVAAADPLQPDLEQTIGFLCGRRVVLQVAPPAEIVRLIDTRYSPDRIVEEILGGLRDEDAGMEFVDGVDAVLGSPAVSSMPVVRLTDHILKTAILQGASDVHLEPDSSGAAVRFRIDGVMRQYMRLPAPVLSRVIARIKVLGRLDIADRLRPQDGRVRVSITGKHYDLRISTVPTRDHEKSVIRVLPQDTGITLDQLDLPAPEREALRELLEERNGIVIVTGPTGSGKTTTLYGALKELSTGDVNIVTVEDPVELDLPGVTQIQVAPKQGVTFASALRAVLRQDPDVILVGEIRDAETAGIAVQAAMTGHLVLATLHANDAAHVVSRLHDLGLDHRAIASTLRGAIAQRLLRRVCPECAKAGRLPDGTPDEGPARSPEGAAEAAPERTGCEACGFTGYKRRIPVAEVLVLDEALSERVASGAAPGQIEAAARAAGMRTLAEVACEHRDEGRTTQAEVERVIGDVCEPDEKEDRSEAQGEGPTPGDARMETPAVPRVPALALEPDPGPAVLVVDDDEESRVLLGALLRRNGFRVAEAVDGHEAIQRLESEGPFALVLLDLVMAGLDGRRTLERIRGNVRTAALPVVVLTGLDSAEQEVELLGSGADDYLRKPVDPERLLARIRALQRRLTV